MEFLGFIAILFIGGLVIQAVREAINSPTVVQAIGEYSPWLAGNSEPLSWVAFIVLAIILLMIPLRLKQRDIETGTNAMEIGGIGIVAALQGLLIALGIVSVGYLASVGWLAATTN